MRTRQRVVDEMLVLAAQAGRSEPFGRLAERWHPRLLRLALALTRDPEGAQEVVQEAWLGIARGLARLQDPALFGPWALKITRRRCADWIRSRRRGRQRTTPLTDAGSLEDPASAGADRRLLVREALHRLAPDVQALLSLYYVEGLSVKEIAEALELPAGTVKSRLFHARARVRANMEVNHGT